MNNNPKSLKLLFIIAVFAFSCTQQVSGGAAIPEPVVFACEKGKIELGNLFENESVKTYSGGIWYRKTISLTKEQAASKNVVLDLGRVVASAEVIFNGKPVGTKSMSPWEFDVTGKLLKGENKIEILVYNTLGNHFLTTPSQYIGRTDSGLMGPVTISIEQIGTSPTSFIKTSHR